MLTRGDLTNIVLDITLGDLILDLRYDEDRPYLQVRCTNGKDSKTGESAVWTSRKWMLSYHMVKSEVVRTAYKAYVAALMHEADETFKYKDATIYNPHANVDVLADVFKKDIFVDSLGDEHQVEDARQNGMKGV